MRFRFGLRLIHPTHSLLFLAAIAAQWFCAGCTSVPNTEFLKHSYATQAVQLKNAWGPISAKTSAAIIDRLKRKTGDLDILDRQLAIEEAVAGHPLVVGNHVSLLLDGPATYEAIFSAVGQARSTINVEFYIIDSGEIGRKFADLLLERRSAGVEVNVIYDSFGGLKPKKEYFDRLREGGVRVVEFNPVNPLVAKNAKRPWKLNHRDHRKLVIVDGRTAFLGGINIDDVYSSSSSAGSSARSSGSSAGSGRSATKNEKTTGWRDTDIRIEGPVVADLQKLFLQSWDKQHGPPLQRERYFPALTPQGKEIVRVIGSSPDDAFSATYLTFVAALTNAQRFVYITNAYFVPDPQLVAALVDAARRGVDVRLILPSTTDSRSAAYAAHSHYTELLKGGVKIYERQSALLHAKTAVVDGVWACVGSANLDWRSAVDNDELNAIIIGREFADQMLEAYALDRAQSDEIELDRWQRRPLRERFKEWFFRLFARML